MLKLVGKRNSQTIAFLLLLFLAFSDATGGTPRNIAPDAPKYSASVSVLKSEIYHKFGILALDRTEQHSPVVLRSLLFLLQEGFPVAVISSLKNLKFIYAYAGHDKRVNVAAYHPQERAISIGGVSSYPSEAITAEGQVELLVALAHEIGHAFLLAHVSPSELRTISGTYGGWEGVFHSKVSSESLFAKVFFTQHPSYLGYPSDGGRTNWRNFNITSDYALTNIHEWFADAFAAFVLERLGKRGILGVHWQTRLKFLPKRTHEYWADYNNLSPGLSDWFEERMKHF